MLKFSMPLPLLTVIILTTLMSSACFRLVVTAESEPAEVADSTALSNYPASIVGRFMAGKVSLPEGWLAATNWNAYMVSE